MNKLFFLLLFVGVTQSFPLPASQNTGGNSPGMMFYCKTPGCADNVTVVFCHDEPLLIRNSTNLGRCTGPPPPNSVCQHGGRAFVSIDTDGVCEFEKEGGYITTERCTDRSNVCSFIEAVTTPVPVTTEVQQNGHAKFGVIASLVVVVVAVIILGLYKKCFCKKNNNQQPASGPVLKNGSSPSPQCETKFMNH